VSKNRTDLIYQTLRNLGALPMGQDPADEDYNLVDGLIEPIIATLRETDTYYLPDVDVIPDEAFLCLSHIMAWGCASGFGQQSDPNLLGLAQYSEKILQVVQAERPHYTTLEIQAY
jgi:hypothetical protein